MPIHQQKLVRFTLAMLPDMHRYLKIVCAEDRMSMHMFVTQAIKEKLESREERRDELAYQEGMKEVSEEKTVHFEETLKELGL